MNTVKPSTLKASVYINSVQTKPANTLTLYTHLRHVCRRAFKHAEEGWACQWAQCRQLLPMGIHGEQALPFPTQGWTVLLVLQG